MTTRLALRLAAGVALALAVGAAPMLAQTPAMPASPAGAWQFATEKMGAGCSLSGNINIVRTGDKAFSCRFNAIWACEQRNPRAVHTEQSCVATQTGENVIITSKIEKVAKVDPAAMTDLMREQYAADHFSVKINRLGDRMDGLFRSYGQAPVVFRKQADLIS